MEPHGDGMHRAVGQTLKTVALAGACLALGCERRQQIAYRELLDSDPQVRADSAVRLGQARAKDAVESLIELLEDQSDRVRMAAVWALGEIGDPRAVAPLMETCSDASVQVRLSACRSLGRLGDARAIPVLTGLLGEMDDRVRLAAARALAEIPGRDSTEALVEVLLEDDNEVIRQQARLLLEHNDAAFARQRMIDALRKNPDAAARAHAARILGDLGGNEAVPALIEAVSDPVPAVRSRAARALALLPTDAGAQESLRKRLGVETEELPQVDLAWCLVLSGDRAHLDTLRRLLEQGATEHVRAEAAMALGDVGEPSDVGRLERAMEGDEMGRVRREAYVAIQKLKRG